MNKFKLVVFDLDGTLVDSDLALVKVGLEIARHFKVKEGINIDDYLHLNGPPLQETLPDLFPHNTLEETKGKYYELSSGTIDDMTLFPGTEDVLKKLLAAGVKLAIFTSRHRRNTEEIIEKYRLNKYFSLVIAGSDNFAPKPSGESLRHIMNELKVTQKETLYVGDNWRDVSAAHDAGVEIGFIMPHRRRHDETLEIDYKLNTITDVLEVVFNE